MELDNSRTLMSNENAVIIEKSFHAPITPHYRNLMDANDKGKLVFDINANLQFHLRIYFPIRQMETLGAKSDKVIVIFNGLDEILPRHFALYDQLGVEFASAGITCILLPTPFHLNRAAALHSSHVAETVHHYKIPSQAFFENPFTLYSYFLQNLYEFDVLKSLLTGQFDQVTATNAYDLSPVSADDRIFFNKHFDFGKVSLSLLGNSLGGLNALSCFAKDPHSIRKCVLLNSGAKLRDTRMTGFVDESVWAQAVQHLGMHTVPKESGDWYEQVSCAPEYPLLQRIFFADEILEFQILEREASKLVIILGGKDQQIPLHGIQRLEPHGYGINLIRISDLGHFHPSDASYNRWSPMIMKLLIELLENPDDNLISKQDALRSLLAFDALCDSQLFNLGRSDIRAKSSDKEELLLKKLQGLCDREQLGLALDLFKVMDRVVLAYVSSEADLRSQLTRLKQRQGLFFGQILRDDFGAKESLEHEITTALKSQPHGTRIGEWLAEQGIISRKEINLVLKRQKSRYRALIASVNPQVANRLDVCLEEASNSISHMSQAES